MQRRSAWILTVALAVLGCGALANGWESHDATRVPAQTIRPGRWILSDNGVLTWTTDDPAVSGAKLPDAGWYAERARGLARIALDIDCQTNGCSAR